MRPLLPALLCVACTRSIDEDRLCDEIGYAIAGRTQTCTGDTALAQQRFEAFADQYTCREVPVETLGADTSAPVAPQDTFACPLAIRNIPCALVEELGDDLDAWLSASEMCDYLTTPAVGG